MLHVAYPMLRVACPIVALVFVQLAVLQPDSTGSGAADEDLDCKLPLWIPDDAVGIARLLRVPSKYSDCPEEYSEYPWSTQIALRSTQSTHLTLWIASRGGSPPAR